MESKNVLFNFQIKNTFFYTIYLCSWPSWCTWNFILLHSLEIKDKNKTANLFQETKSYLGDIIGWICQINFYTNLEEID